MVTAQSVLKGRRGLVKHVARRRLTPDIFCQNKTYAYAKDVYFTGS